MNAEMTLKERVRASLHAHQIDVDELALRTKVPRATLRWFLGEEVTAIVPARVYLRGHFRLVAKELTIPEAEAMALFDAAFPQVVDERDVIESVTPKRSGMWRLAAGVFGVGIVAALLSIFS